MRISERKKKREKKRESSLSLSRGEEEQRHCASPERRTGYFQLYPGSNPFAKAVPAKNIFFPELVYRLSTPIICDAARDGSPKVAREICLHVIRINVSFSFSQSLSTLHSCLVVLLFTSRCVFELTSLRGFFDMIFPSLVVRA